MRDEAERIKTGDRIEFAYTEIDEVSGAFVELWKLVEIIEFIGPAPSGDLMFNVRQQDGTITHESTARQWRWVRH
jgi:hypothetical protein